ncbi:MAG: hypothetical protein EKK40_10040 [Bradyrhizobiaceae bacterium]|nr:MAG: hypothetical protein EKK40_10040 [Bradyrhizobiaceae bacterium]
MSDPSADHSENQTNSADETVKHGSSELVPVAATHTADGEPHSDAHASKEITLQRLTPHSSWNGTFGDTMTFDEKAFEEALREPAPLVEPQSVRRALPLAAMIAITVLIGAVSGAAATFGLAHFAKDDQTAKMAERGRMLDQALAKVDAELATVKADAASAAKANSARIAKMNDTMDKFRPSEVTGSIAPPLPSSLPSPAPSIAAPPTQFARLPIVDGWVLREVADGGALVEGRLGTYEVFAGDPLPGVGRVDAIRRQDGRWVVVTSRGLIVAR